MNWLAPGLAAAVVAAACTMQPADPFVVAQRSLLQHDLAESLRALDAVPVAHARYPEARAAAVAVERSMRRCHELMLEAMLLRAEWRDRDALASLRKARSIWPALPGIDVLIAATEQRLRLLVDHGDAPPSRAATSASPAPPPRALLAATEPDASSAPAAPAAETMPPPAPATVPQPRAASGTAPAPFEPPVAPPAAPAATITPATITPAPIAPTPIAAAGTAAAPPPVAPVAAAQVDDPVALGLVAVETRLGRNELEPAVVDLLELSRRFPDDARVRVRLVRLLHQRALLRYGEGAVAMAIADWRRLLEIDPHHGPARRMLEAVELEGR